MYFVPGAIQKTRIDEFIEVEMSSRKNQQERRITELIDKLQSGDLGCSKKLIAQFDIIVVSGQGKPLSLQLIVLLSGIA